MPSKYDLPKMLPGGEYLKDVAEQINAAPNEVAKAGLTLRGIAGAPVAWTADMAQGAWNEAKPVVGAVGQFGKTLFTGDTTPMGYRPPAVTQNAVTTAAATPAPSPTGPSSVPDPVNFFKTNLTAPNQAAAEQNYGAYKDREAARAAQAGQPVDYPGKMNLMPSSGGIDFGIPRMAAAGALPQMQQPVQQGYAGGGGGLFPPGLMASIQQYHDLSRKADNGSLSGAWRARGYAKQRDNLIAGAVHASMADAGMISAGAHVTGAQAQMMQAQNQPYLEAQKNAVAMYGHDITGRGQNMNYALGMQQDQTHRYATDVGAGTAKYRTDTEAAVAQRGQDYTLAPHLPQMEVESRGLKAIDAGDMATGKELYTMGKQPQMPRLPVTHEDMSGNTVVVHPDGRTEVLSPAMKAAMALKAQADPYKKQAAKDVTGK